MKSVYSDIGSKKIHLRSYIKGTIYVFMSVIEKISLASILSKIGKKKSQNDLNCALLFQSYNIEDI